MSQQEFETYLSVLCRLLRLAPEQREQIAEELRDHLETRLEELKSQGVSHTDAVRLALDEFGDAAGVAASFFSHVREQRRRWVMRVTTISVGAAAAAVLLSLAFWPESQHGPAPRRAVAQIGGAPPANPGTTIPGGGVSTTPVKAAPAPRKPTELEEKLTKRVTVEFIETPLRDVLTFLSDTNEAQFYVNIKALEEHGISTDAPVTLRLKDVRMDTALDLALEQAGNGVLGYVERDGVLIISEASLLADRLEVQVYNCRDLLSLEVPAQNAAAMRMGMSMLGAPAASPMGYSPGPATPMGGAGGISGSGGPGGFNAVSGFGSQHDARANHLMMLVSQIVKPDSWAVAGGPGSIAEYGGLLVVRQNPQAHREVEKLLAMLREQATPAAK